MKTILFQTLSLWLPFDRKDLLQFQQCLPNGGQCCLDSLFHQSGNKLDHKWDKKGSLLELASVQITVQTFHISANSKQLKTAKSIKIDEIFLLIFFDFFFSLLFYLKNMQLIQYLLGWRFWSHTTNWTPPIFNGERSQSHCQSCMESGHNTVAEIKRAFGEYSSHYNKCWCPWNNSNNNCLCNILFHFLYTAKYVYAIQVSANVHRYY